MTQLESPTYFCGAFRFYYLIALFLSVHNFKVLVNSHSSQQKQDVTLSEQLLLAHCMLYLPSRKQQTDTVSC